MRSTGVLLFSFARLTALSSVLYDLWVSSAVQALALLCKQMCVLLAASQKSGWPRMEVGDRQSRNAC